MKTIETLEAEIKALGGTVTWTYDSRRRPFDTSDEVEAYFDEYNYEIESQLEEIANDTTWSIDLYWDGENNGVLFDRTV